MLLRLTRRASSENPAKSTCPREGALRWPCGDGGVGAGVVRAARRDRPRQAPRPAAQAAEKLDSGAASLASCLVALPVQTTGGTRHGENGTCASGGSRVRHQLTPGTRVLAVPRLSETTAWAGGPEPHPRGQAESDFHLGTAPRARPLQEGGNTRVHTCRHTDTYTGARTSRHARAHPHMLAHTPPMSPTS